MLEILSWPQQAVLGTVMLLASVLMRAKVTQTTDFHARVPTVRNDWESQARSFLASLFLMAGLVLLGFLAGEFVLVTSESYLQFEFGELGRPLALVALGSGFLFPGWAALKTLNLNLENRRKRELGVSGWVPTGETILYVSTEDDTVEDRGPIGLERFESFLNEFHENFQILCEKLETDDIYAVCGLAYDPCHFLEISVGSGEEGFTVYLCLDENPVGALINWTKKATTLTLENAPLDSALNWAGMFMELPYDEFSRRFENDGAGKP